MFVLAHLSDPHLPPLPQPGLRDLLGKRVTGYLNWRCRRSRHHSAAVAAAIAADIAAAAPDHVAVTGDLVNLSLPAEYPLARAFLERIGPPGRVTLVPGNHDAYVRGSDESLLAAWGDYMSGDEPAVAPFPFLRRRGPVALIGLSTAVPTPPLFATGRIGAGQLARFDTLLAELGARQCFRVVLIHHPPAGERPWLRRLEDAAAFRAIIARRGAELVLSGHDHVAAAHEIAGPARPVPVIQVPSASAPLGDRHGAGAYNLYRIAGRPGAWTCESETRAIGADGGVRALARAPLLAAAVTAA